MKQVTGRKMTQVYSFSFFWNSSSFISIAVTSPNMSEMSFCWAWGMVLRSFTRQLISHSSTKFQNYFLLLNSWTALPFLILNISVSGLRAKNVLTLLYNPGIRLVYGTRCPHFQHWFLTRKIETGTDWVHEIEWSSQLITTIFVTCSDFKLFLQSDCWCVTCWSCM